MIVDLKVQYHQESISDLSALRHVSDSSQDRVVLVLLQLQQRITRAGPIEHMNSPPSSSLDPHAPSDQNQHDTTTRNVNVSIATGPIEPSATFRELPALPHSDSRNALEALTIDFVRSLQEHPESSNMNSPSHDVPIKPLPPPPTYKTPYPPPPPPQTVIDHPPANTAHPQPRLNIFCSH